jgi:predicted RNase H-like HicB family nuclease
MDLSVLAMEGQVRYTAIVDGKAGAYGVVIPDVPGCVAMGRSIDEALANSVETLAEFAKLEEAAGKSLRPPRRPEEILADPSFADDIAAALVLASVPLIREAGKPVRANLSLDPGILAAIDAAAQRMGLTRSAMVEALAKEGLPKLVA